MYVFSVTGFEYWSHRKIAVRDFLGDQKVINFHLCVCLPVDHRQRPIKTRVELAYGIAYYKTLLTVDSCYSDATPPEPNVSKLSTIEPHKTYARKSYYQRIKKWLLLRAFPLPLYSSLVSKTLSDYQFSFFVHSVGLSYFKLKNTNSLSAM